MNYPRFYWDTSCFISYLSATHPDEQHRALVCKDILHHAQNDNVEIWTSAWTIVEVIRPRQKEEIVSLPDWANALKITDADERLLYPKAIGHLTEIWNYYHRHTAPTRKLTDDELSIVRSIFLYPFVKIAMIEQTVANEAVQISRSTGIRPGDSLHVASAIARKCDCIHRWDRDFTKTDHLITSKEPEMISPQSALFLTTAVNQQLLPVGDGYEVKPQKRDDLDRDQSKKGSDEREADPPHSATV